MTASLLPLSSAEEVESHGRRGPRRGWRRNGATCRGAVSSELPFVDSQASAERPDIRQQEAGPAEAELDRVE